jgi:pyrophosphatase PpaX
MRTILFDFDGTVADTLPLIFTAFRSTFQQFLHRRYADEEIVAMFGPTETGILQAIIPPDQVEQALDHFFRVYAEGHRHVHNSAEIALMLDRLREADIVMGIVTGKGRRSADISLQAWGLARYFDVVITGDDVSRPKPDPEGILSAMERLGARAEQTLYVGDSDADVLAGRAAALVTVGVDWLPVTQKAGRFQPEPDYLFTDPGAFADWVLGEQKPQ